MHRHKTSDCHIPAAQQKIQFVVPPFHRSIQIVSFRISVPYGNTSHQFLTAFTQNCCQKHQTAESKKGIGIEMINSYSLSYYLVF